MFLVIAAAASVFTIIQAASGKMDELSSRISDLIRKKYGVEISVPEMKPSFFPPEIHFKKIVIEAAASKQALAELNGCTLSDLWELVFSSDKKIKLNCEKSVFYTDDHAKILYFLNKAADKNQTSVSNGKSEKTANFSFHFATEATLLFAGNPIKFMLDSDFSHQRAALNFKEFENNSSGTAELVVFLDSKKASLRLDGIELEKYRDFIKETTSFDISKGKITSFLEIEKKNDDELLCKNDISVENIAFFHPLLDSETFTLPLLRFKGGILLNTREKSLHITGSDVSLGGINAKISVTYNEGSLDFSIKTESAGLNKLETLIHNSVFENYLFGGSLELSAEYSKKGDEPPLFSVSGNLSDPKQLSDRLDYLKKGFEYDFINENGIKRTIFVGESNPHFTPFAMLPQHLVWAVVISEDAGFFLHNGIDFQELNAAVNDNIQNHRLRGGSTIPQQLAKNLFLSREKTLLRKLREVLLSIELDATLSKERLLEIYFNIVEWAPGIFGIADAAEYYFAKRPEDLTALESAYLASVIPGPSKYHYQFLTKNVSENWYKNLFRLLGIMNTTGHLSDEEYEKALYQTLIFRENEEEQF